MRLPDLTPQRIAELDEEARRELAADFPGWTVTAGTASRPWTAARDGVGVVAVSAAVLRAELVGESRRRP